MINVFTYWAKCGYFSRDGPKLLGTNKSLTDSDGVQCGHPYYSKLAHGVLRSFLKKTQIALNIFGNDMYFTDSRDYKPSNDYVCPIGPMITL